jgi:hypothetical protein
VYDKWHDNCSLPEEADRACFSSHSMPVSARKFFLKNPLKYKVLQILLIFINFSVDKELRLYYSGANLGNSIPKTEMDVQG